MKTASTIPDAVKLQLLLNILLSGKQGFLFLQIFRNFEPDFV
jgi:hypothetical protein